MDPSTPRNRVSAGVPTGGQFAPSAHPEPGFTLDDYEEVEEASAWVADLAAADPEAYEAPDAFEHLSADAVIEQARVSGSYWGRRYGVDPDEVTASTVTAFTGAMRRRSRPSELGNHEAYLHSVARSFAASSIAGAERGEDRRAWTEYRRRIDGLGHSPTEDEQDAIAEEVRMSQPARRRASVGFHRRSRAVSLDGPGSYAGIEGVTDGGISEVEDRLSPGARQWPELERPTTHRGRVELRRSAWSLYAPDAPQAAPGTLTPAQATRNRKQVARTGGVMAAAAAWRSGDIDAPTAEAFFSPFGDLDEAGRDEVVDRLVAHPTYATDLWSSAVMAATDRRPRAVSATSGSADGGDSRERISA